MLPVYTRYLSKADYGILEILAHTNGVFRIILLAGFGAALGKFYNFEKDLLLKKRVISTGTTAIFILGLLGSTVCFLFNDILANIVLGSEEYTRYINLNIIILFFDMQFFAFTIYYIVEKKSYYFIALNLIKLIVAIIANLFCIIYLEMGAMGMLYGNLISLIVSSIPASYYSIRNNGLHFEISLFNDMLKFGLPTVTAALSAAVMHNADRFFIRYYCTLDDVGIYGLGYNFPWMLNTLLLQSFNLIWGAAVMYEISKEKDASYQFGRIATYFMIIFIFCQLGVSIFSTSILKILAAPKFFEAYSVIPIVALGVSFHALYTFFSAGAFIKEKTWLLNVAYFPAACINISLNIILLPRFGYMAAAWTTVLTYFSFSLLLYLACRRTIDISFEFRRLAYLFLLAFCVFFLSSKLYLDKLILDILIQSICVSVFFIILISGRFFTPGEKSYLIQEVKKVYTMARNKWSPNVENYR